MHVRNILIFFGFVWVETLHVTAKNNEEFIQMPDVSPQKHDTYLCTKLKLPNKETQVIGYVPEAKMDTAHHMLLYSCNKPGLSDASYWNCGEMVGGSDDGGLPRAGTCARGSKLIYAWAMNAPALHLPEGVAFKLPAGDTLVLQVHYNKVDKFKHGETDKSGIRLLTTEDTVPKSAAVYLLGTGGKVPKKEVSYEETACKIRHKKEMHPFAFRTHTHKHGRVVSAYRVRDGKWTEIGRGNPRRPQMFYNVTGPAGTTIKEGDYVAARCTMFNRHNHDVHMGGTGNDEMCNFYMMYWVDGDLERNVDSSCWSSGVPYSSWAKMSEIQSLKNAPLEISVQPTLGKGEEEVVRDDPEPGEELLSEDDRRFVIQTNDGGRFYMDKRVWEAMAVLA